MKLKLQKLAVGAAKFVFQAVFEKLLLMLVGAASAAVMTGFNKFRQNRLAKKAAEKTEELQANEKPVETAETETVESEDTENIMESEETVVETPSED